MGILNFFFNRWVSNLLKWCLIIYFFAACIIALYVSSMTLIEIRKLNPDIKKIRTWCISAGSILLFLSVCLILASYTILVQTFVSRSVTSIFIYIISTIFSFASAVIYLAIAQKLNQTVLVNSNDVKTVETISKVTIGSMSGILGLVLFWVLFNFFYDIHKKNKDKLKQRKIEEEKIKDYENQKKLKLEEEKRQTEYQNEQKQKIKLSTNNKDKQNKIASEEKYKQKSNRLDETDDTEFENHWREPPNAEKHK